MTIEDLNINPEPELATIVKRRRIRILVSIDDMDTVDGVSEDYFVISNKEVALSIYDIVETPIKDDAELPPLKADDLKGTLERAMGPIARELVRQASE